MFTNSVKTEFVPANRELTFVQIIFQIRAYKPASFLNYKKYRVKNSKNLVRQMGLHFISYLPKLTSTVLSRTLSVQIKILYQVKEFDLGQKSKDLKKMAVLCQNSMKFLNLSDKSVIKDLVSN